ncbi:MAG: FtsX-like permease family protein [Candidatus Cryptobacteroides sp.]
MKSFFAILRKYTVAMVMNFIGLTLGFTAFMVLMVQVGYESSFDRNHPTSGRIYRVDKIGIDKDDIFRNILPRGYADDIISCSPHIEAGSIACPFLSSIVFNVASKDGRLTEPFEGKVNLVYPEVFKVFGAEFIEGNADAIADMQSVAIPLSLARKLFGNESAIGRIISHNEKYLFGAEREQNLVVGAVYKDFPENSQICNDIFLNIGDLQKGSYGGANFCCYLLLDSPGNKELVERTFNETTDYEDSEWLTDIELTPVEDIYFADAGSAIYKNGSRSQMWILICISIVVLLIGGINYTTFFTALAPMRVKNINTRKILGSSVLNLRAGLVSEAVAFSLTAFALALCIISPISSALAAEGLVDMPFRFPQQGLLIVISAFMALIIGIIAGIFPSIYVTSLPPAFALKGDMQYSLSGKRFRWVMMVLQYAVSFVLLIFVISLYRQNEYLISRDNGFDKDNVAVVKISQSQYARNAGWLRQRLSAMDEFEDVAYSMECMGGQDVYSTSTFNFNGKPFRTFVFYCSPNFLRVMGIPVIEGRDFLESDKTGGCVIINKAAVDQGIEMANGGALDGIEIIGRTGDVCINSLRQEVSPVCYIALPDGYASLTWAYIRLADGFDRRECVRKINEVLLEMDPSYLFDVKLYDNILGELYKPEIKQEKIVSLFSLLAAILALVGIFGQVLLDLQYSRRTIAIRKVYGADNSPLIWDCLKKYTFKLLLSFLIAVPLGWLAIVRWQEGFAEKVGISRLEFVVAFLMIAALTMAIVVVMSWRAVRANPVESLRKE